LQGDNSHIADMLFVFFYIFTTSFPPSEHLPNPILKVCAITLHTDKRKGGNHLRDYLLYTFLVG